MPDPSTTTLQGHRHWLAPPPEHDLGAKTETDPKELIAGGRQLSSLSAGGQQVLPWRGL